MSEENVEIVRSSVEALRRALLDPSQFGPYLEFLAADYEYRPEGGPEDIRSYGRDEVQGYAEEWLQDWDDLQMELDEAIDLGGDRVFTAFRLRGTGKRTGLSLGLSGYAIYTLRNGKVVLMEEFQNRAEALEAAGLSE